jgi:hypothetical protein
MDLFCNYSKYNIYICAVFRVIMVIYIHGIPIKIVTYINKRKLYFIFYDYKGTNKGFHCPCIRYCR